MRSPTRAAPADQSGPVGHPNSELIVGVLAIERAHCTRLLMRSLCSLLMRSLCSLLMCSLYWVPVADVLDVLGLLLMCSMC